MTKKELQQGYSKVELGSDVSVSPWCRRGHYLGYLVTLVSTHGFQHPNAMLFSFLEVILPLIILYIVFQGVLTLYLNLSTIQ